MEDSETDALAKVDGSDLNGWGRAAAQIRDARVIASLIILRRVHAHTRFCHPLPHHRAAEPPPLPAKGIEEPSLAAHTHHHHRVPVIQPTQTHPTETKAPTAILRCALHTQGCAPPTHPKMLTPHATRKDAHIPLPIICPAPAERKGTQIQPPRATPSSSAPIEPRTQARRADSRSLPRAPRLERHSPTPEDRDRIVHPSTPAPILSAVSTHTSPSSSDVLLTGRSRSQPRDGRSRSQPRDGRSRSQPRDGRSRRSCPIPTEADSSPVERRAHAD
ncbi:hypothetical protein DFH09DRAFT_1308518 [Mycena vulgaris]|nr:hypothetical protein DFH09DRAFT_1308518 [Mycena vulgaris]